MAKDLNKRRFLLAATTVASGAAIAGASVPFVASMLPSERAKAGGAPAGADFPKPVCVPSFRPDVAPGDLRPRRPGGYYCTCHGSRFDFAGRVYRNVPAPTNLVVPPYHYVSAMMVRIGEDPDGRG